MLARVVLRSLKSGVDRQNAFFRALHTTGIVWQKPSPAVERIAFDDLPEIIEKPKKPKPRKSRKKATKETKAEEEKVPDAIPDRNEVDNNGFTAFYQDLRNTIDEYSKRVDGEYVVLIQVGSFYELYFEQAQNYAGLLGLTLTKKKLKNQDVAFAGFPDYKLDKYLRLIFEARLKAVVCEQRKDLADNDIIRPVDRLVTRGTVVDDGIRDYHRNNHLLAIKFPENPFKGELLEGTIGLAWCDVTLGTFYVLETTFEDLMAAIVRINPSEILIDELFDFDSLTSGHRMPQFADLRNYYVTRYRMPNQQKQIIDFVGRYADNTALVLSAFDEMKQKETSAARMLLHYLDQCIPNYNTCFQLPTRSLPKQVMHIDPHAAQDLELTETIQGGFRVGALANIIDRTVTNPGARLLSSWLLMPSTEVKEIRKRHQFVTAFLKNEDFVDELIVLLRRTGDINRIIRRIDNDRADFSEYIDMATTILILEEVFKLAMDTPKLMPLMNPLFEPLRHFKQLHNLATRILNTIDPHATSSNSRFESTNGFKMETEIIRDSWNIQRDSSPRLQALRNTYDQYVQEHSLLEAKLSEQFKEMGYNGSIRFVRNLRDGSFQVDLKSGSKAMNTIASESDYRVIQKNRSAMKLGVPEWEALGPQMIHLEQDIQTEENIIMEALKEKIFSLADDLKEVSPVIEFLDTMQSFTNMARQKNLVCPVVDKSLDFEVTGGRHLVVEEGLQNRSKGVENFTPNDCHLSSRQAWVITGPNMGGKSTFMRQNAIIAILAQIGSFVPAESARIGIIDKIFTRVGSSDNIFKNQSTFMVEMNETAVILRQATPRSFIIVDELGRGTSTGEGVAIAFASLLSMVNNNKSKVLFATHFGPELSNEVEGSEELKDSVKFYRTALKRLDGGNLPIDQRLVFDHKLAKGLSRYSHALEIAELAGFPQTTLKAARDVLEKKRSID